MSWTYGNDQTSYNTATVWNVLNGIWEMLPAVEELLKLVYPSRRYQFLRRLLCHQGKSSFTSHHQSTYFMIVIQCPKGAGSFNDIWINSCSSHYAFTHHQIQPLIEVILGFCRLNLSGMRTDVLIICQRETLQPTMQYFTSLNPSVFNTMHIINPKSPTNIQG